MDRMAGCRRRPGTAGVSPARPGSEGVREINRFGAENEYENEYENDYDYECEYEYEYENEYENEYEYEWGASTSTRTGATHRLRATLTAVRAMGVDRGRLARPARLGGGAWDQPVQDRVRVRERVRVRVRMRVRVGDEHEYENGVLTPAAGNADGRSPAMGTRASRPPGLGWKGVRGINRFGAE